MRLTVADSLGFGPMSEWDAGQYLRWHAALIDVLKLLGIQPPAPRQLTADEALSAIRRMHQSPEQDDAA